MGTGLRDREWHLRPAGPQQQRGKPGLKANPSYRIESTELPRAGSQMLKGQDWVSGVSGLGVNKAFWELYSLLTSAES